MGLKYSEEQEGLIISLKRFFEDQVDSAYLRKRIEGTEATDPEFWSKFLELGLFEYFSCDDEDYKPSFHELAIIAHESGRVLAPESFSDVLCFGPYLLTQLLDPSDRESLSKVIGAETLTEISCGNKRATFASCGKDISLSVKAGRSTLSGTWAYVPSAGVSDLCVFLAEDKAETKLGIFTLGSKVKVTPEPCLDGTIKRFSVELKEVPCVILKSVEPKLIASLETILRASEAAGLCSKVIEMTVDYVKTRKQFGVAVGSFQAVQHKLADMLVQTKSLSSLANFAAWAAENSPEQLALSAKAAIGRTCQVVPEVVETAIQLHGGIGFTWEHDLHFYLRRAKTLETLYSFSESDYDEILKFAS